MSVIIQHKRGTASQWTSLNPTLDAGEVGWESDTNKFKIGIGSTAWNSLPYATLTPSELSSGYARLAFPNAFTVGGHTITNDAAGTVPLLIKTASGQTAGFMEFRDSGNNLQTIFTAGASIRTAGNLVAGNTSTALGQLTSYASSASTIGAVIRGAAGQTSSLQEWQDSSSTVLTSITSAGNLNTGQIRSGTTSGLAQITGIAGNATTIGMIIRGAASQTANLTEWQNSAGTVLSRVDKNGSISAPYFGPSGTGLLGYLDWTTNSPIFWTGNGSVVGAIIRGHGSGGSSTQTANLQEWQSWNGTTASTVLFVGSGGQLRAGGSIAGTGWAINNQVYGASVIPLVVRGATSQSANLQEWQNDAGSTLSAINSVGAFTGYLSTTNTGRTGTISYITPGASSQATWANYPVGLSTMVNANQSANGTPTNNFQYFFKVANRDFAGGWGGLSIDYATGDLYTGRAATSSDYAIWHKMANTSLANTFSGTQTIVSSSATTVPLISRGAANQLEDTLEIQNSSSTVLGGFNANAQIYSGSSIPLTTSTGGVTTAASGTGTVATITTTSNHNLSTGDRVTIAGITPTGYNGTFIVTGTPTTTSFTYNNATTGSQTVAGTVSVDAQTSIVARSAATTPLILRAAVNQGVNMFRIEGSGGSSVASIDAAGGMTIGTITLTSEQLRGSGGLTSIGVAANRNTFFNAASGSFGGGQGVNFFANAGIVPTSNPTGGGILYVNSGALAYRGTSGSAVTIVNADGTSPYATLTGINTFTGNQIWNNSVQLGPGLNTSVGIEIGYTGGSATTPYIDFHSGATAVDFDSRIIASGGNGSNAGGTLTYNAAAHNFAGVITSQNSVTSQAGLALSGASSPLTLNGSTGTTGQVLTSAGAGTTPTWSSSFISTTSSYFAGHHPEGRVMYNSYLTNDFANARLRGSTFTITQNGSPYSVSNTDIDAMFDGTASFWNISPTSGFTFPLVIQFTLPRTLTYGTWVGIGFGNSGWRANSVKIEVFSLNSSTWVTLLDTASNTSEDVFVAVSGLSGGNSLGISQIRYTLANPNSTQLRIAHIWGYNFASDMWSQTMMPRGGGSFYGPISATTVSDAVVMSVRGAASGGASIQTADLQRWQTWDGTTTTTRARIDSGGNLKANNVASLNSTIQMTENAGGGLLIFGRATAASGNPGANFANIYFRDGTTSGTLRLATRTGASGIEETIVDNLSSTGSTAGAQFTGAGGVRTTGLINTNSSQYGNTILFAAPASTTYYLLATLPISSAGTYDHIQIDGIGGGWGSGDYSTYSFTFANRNAFSYKYELSNRDVMANFKLRAYSQVDGSVQIWASGEASAFLKFAYNISSAQNVTTVANPVATTTAPSGTVVFDSSNTATYPPVRSIYGGMSIFNTTTGTTPLLVRGVSGQTADLVKIQNNTPTDLFAISSAGLITAKVVSNAANQSRGIMLSNTSDLWQSGLYLKSDGSGNPRLTLLAPTGGMGEAVSIDSAAKVGFNNINPTGQVDITTASTTRVALIVRPQTSQTADLIQIRNSADNANLAVFDSSGRLNSNTAGNFGGLAAGSAFLGVQTSANTLGLLVKGGAQQVADIARYVDSGNNTLGGRNGVGQIYTGSTTPILTASGGTIQSIAAGANPLVTLASAHGFTTGDLVTLAGTTGGTYDGTFVVASTPASTTFTIASGLTAGQAAAGGTASDPAQLSVTAKSPGTIGAVIRGVASQTANLTEWQDSTGTVLARVEPTGKIVSGQNIAALGSLHSWNILTSGTSETQYSTATLSIGTRAAGNIGAIIRGATSQSADLLQLQNSGGTTLSYFDSTGTPVAPAYAHTAGAFRLLQASSGGVLQLTKATSAVSNVGADVGRIYLRDGTTAGTLRLATITGASGVEETIVDNLSSTGSTAGATFTGAGGVSTAGNIAASNGTFINTGAIGNTVLTLRGVSGQTGDLQHWQANGPSTLAKMGAQGNLVLGGTSTLGQLSIYADSSSRIGAVIRGASGQSVDLLQIQSNTPSTLFSIGSDGTITHNAFFQNFNNMLTSGRMAVGLSALPSGVQFGVYSSATTNVGAIVRGASGQTADLQQWQSWDGTTATNVARVTSGGDLFANRVRTLNSAFRGQEGNGGGQVLLERNTSLPTNPGANLALLYFRDGTTAGTLKLIARTGASGVEETIVDNLSSTGSTAGAQFVGAGGINTAGSLQTTAGLNLSGAAATVTLNGSVGTSGQVLTSAGAGATPTWTTVSGGTFTGGTLTSNLTLDDGTTTSAPLTFVSGTNLTTPASGAIEYDGTVFYQTSNTNPGRALNTQNYYYVSSADYAPDYSTSASVQSMLGATTRGITVAAGTTYEYEFYTTVQHQYITNTGITGTYALTSSTVSGSPVVSTVHQIDYGSNTTSFTTATTMSTIRTTGSVVFSAAISSGSRYNFLRAKGVIRVTGTGTAELYPGLSLSGIAGDNIWTIQNGTVFKLTPIGNGTVTQVGTWA